MAARYWYSFDNTGNPYSPGSYTRQTSRPGCINGPVICTVYVPGGNQNPLPFSPNMRQYIANGLANNVAEPATPPGVKFFVYLKGLSQ